MKMSCIDVRDRLVAWQDEELSPGETVLVAEHLDGCAACRDQERGLARATPRPFLQIPAAMDRAALDRLHRALDVAAVTPAPRARPRPALPDLSRFAYAAILMTAIGFGLYQWSSARRLEAELASRIETPVPSAAIPGDQYMPASWKPPAPPPP